MSDYTADDLFRFYDDDLDDEVSGGDEDDDRDFGCCFPDRCLMPGEHLRSECYDVEMAEAWREEQVQ